MPRRRLCRLQRPGELVRTEDDPRRHSLRADKLERTWRRPLRKDALPRTQQDWIHNQQHFIRERMLQQRRCQRRAAREDKVRTILRLDAPNALNDVRSKALEWAPRKTFRAV